jgi:hypothetical protein
MEMKSLLTNWKTTLAGVVIIVLGAMNTFLGIHVPGFNLDFLAALTTGSALLFAKDNNVTGGSTPQ